MPVWALQMLGVVAYVTGGLITLYVWARIDGEPDEDQVSVAFGAFFFWPVALIALAAILAVEKGDRDKLAAEARTNALPIALNVEEDTWRPRLRK